MGETPSTGRGRRAAGALALACASTVAQGQGLSLHPPANAITGRTPGEYALAHPALGISSIRVFGNYYLFDPANSTLGPTMTSVVGGFRVSTGVAGFGQPLSLFDAQPELARNAPYFGLGYSHLWFTGQLSLNADFGLASQNAISAGYVRPPSLDEVTRDLRWGPVMAVNLKYAF